MTKCSGKIAINYLTLCRMTSTKELKKLNYWITGELVDRNRRRKELTPKEEQT